MESSHSHLSENVFEGIQHDARHGKAKKDKLQQAPEIVEVLPPVCSDFLHALVEEVEHGDAEEDFHDENDETKPTYVAHQAEHLNR